MAPPMARSYSAPAACASALRAHLVGPRRRSRCHDQGRLVGRSIRSNPRTSAALRAPAGGASGQAALLSRAVALREAGAFGGSGARVRWFRAAEHLFYLMEPLGSEPMSVSF